MTDKNKLASSIMRNKEYEDSFKILLKEFADFVEIPIKVNVVIGERKIKVRELLNFEPGHILDLKRSAGESLMIYLKDTFFAKGEVTVIEDTFGVRITEINDPRKV
jgi:flagellar motor switch protein FliN/FliY